MKLENADGQTIELTDDESKRFVCEVTARATAEALLRDDRQFAEDLASALNSDAAKH